MSADTPSADQPSANSPVSEEAVAAAPAANPEEGLPLDFPLTPEDVQDEAVRGDFVIRWAVVLLGLLMGFALIDQTLALVHVKSGQYLLEHGMLPPRGGDVFSATAGNRTWFNLSWLFDVLAAGAYGLGSWMGVSVLKALLVAGAFWQMVKISRPGLPTWWGSVCAIPALLACQPRFTALPEVVTLLGVAVTLRLLHEWRNQGSVRALWGLVPLFWLWSNLDAHVFVGAWLLVLTVIGEALTRVPAEGRRAMKPLLATSACALLATLAHPFPGAWLSEPMRLFQEIYPAFQSYTLGGGAAIQYYPVASPEFFRNPHPSGICGLLLFVTAGVTLFLNRKRLQVADLLLYFGFAVLMVLSVHELGAASLVFCAIATLNGQSWYQNRFSLEYSTSSRFLLLSRGGRAVTVLGLFGIAIFTVVGSIRAPGGARLGFGLSPELAGHVASYESLLEKTHGEKGFDFNPGQGDLMIWCGKKPFIDQRLGLYLGEGEGDLIGLHRKTRDTFRITERTTFETKRAGVETLKKHEITFAVPRLTGFNPDYQTMTGLLSDPNWRLQRMGASTAVFYLFDAENPELVKFLQETQQVFPEEAFRKEADGIPARAGWPTSPTVYEQYLWGPSEDLSPESQEGQHLMRLARLMTTPNPSMAYLAIRRVQNALGRNPNDVLGYIVLGEAYTYLSQFDLMNAPARGSSLEQLRYLQAVAAYHHALIADPEQVNVRLALFDLYRRSGKADLALEQLQKYSDLSQRYRLFQGTEFDAQEQARTAELLKGLREQVAAIDQEVAKAVEKVPEEQRSLSRFGLYYQRGLVLKALEEAENFPPSAMANPDVIKLQTMSLLEAGRTEEAYEKSGQLEGAAQQNPSIDWRGVRTICLLVNGEYDRAIQLWDEVTLEATRNGFAGLLVNLTPQFMSGRPMNWPLTELQAAGNYFYSFKDQVSSLKLNAALARIEAGSNRKAGETLQEILDQNPEASERRTIAYYLSMIQQVPVDPLPPSERVPVLFAPETKEAGREDGKSSVPQ